jgi:hypothetical protein
LIQNDDHVEEHDRNLMAQAAYAAATRAGNGEAMLAMSEPDAVVWHNYDQVAISTERSNRALAWLHRTVPDAHWTDVAVLPTPEGFVWRSVLTGTAPAGALRVHSCIIVTLSGAGKVLRSDEYLDTAALAVLTR